jgi:hypothetical protein
MTRTEQNDRVDTHRHGTLQDDSVFSSTMEKLLVADWGGRWGESLTADELLVIGAEALEPLFQEPPLGPIPDYLAPHWSVYSCVAEYEDKLEELDRWKALALSRWLKGRIGRTCRVAEQVYQLQMEMKEGAISERFLLRLIEDRTEYDKLTTYQC